LPAIHWNKSEEIWFTRGIPMPFIDTPTSTTKNTNKTSGW